MILQFTKRNEQATMLNRCRVNGRCPMHAKFYVSHREASEARNTAMWAMSSGCPKRPRGVCAINCFCKSLPITHRAYAPSVSVPPGLTELTRMFRDPSSFGGLCNVGLHGKGFAARARDLCNDAIRTLFAISIIDHDCDLCSASPFAIPAPMPFEVPVTSAT